MTMTMTMTMTYDLTCRSCVSLRQASAGKALYCNISTLLDNQSLVPTFQNIECFLSSLIHAGCRFVAPTWREPLARMLSRPGLGVTPTFQLSHFIISQNCLFAPDFCTLVCTTTSSFYQLSKLILILIITLKGIVHQIFFYRSNLIFWILMGCGNLPLVRLILVEISHTTPH